MWTPDLKFTKAMTVKSHTVLFTKFHQFSYT